MEKKLSDLTVVELKSLAYDELAKLENAQQNLRVLNQEIAKRVQEQQAQQAQQEQEGQQEDPTANNTTDDGVVDAEFEEVD